MRMLWRTGRLTLLRLLVPILVAALCTPVFGGAAQAREAPRDFGVVSYTGIDEAGKAAAPRLAERSGDLGEAARRTARQLGQTSSLDPLATKAATDPRRPPGEPGGTEVDDCLNSEGAHNRFGRVYNRFMWCQRYQLEAKKFTTGQTGTRLTASMTMEFSAVAYGRDDGKRGITVFFRGDDADYWPTTKGYIRPESMLYQRVGCFGESGCGEDFSHTGMQIKDWIGRWTSFELTSDGSVSSMPDKVSRHLWFFHGYVIDSWNFRLADGQSDQRTIRCDSATNFGLKRRGACVFDDVIPHLQYSVNDDRVDEVAKHIRCAQAEPWCERDGAPFQTYPRKEAAKLIPGKFHPGERNDDLALHRINASKTPDPRYTKNRNVVRSTCATLPTDIYDTSKGQQCDEYPFASTAEGAACCEAPKFDWDFSVMGAFKDDNECAGRALKKYYRDDRILYEQDGFFVHIKDDPPAGSDSCEAIPPEEDEPEDGGGTPPANLAPTANAGPDVSGDEGAAVTLRGSASDPENDPLTLTWSVTPGPGVDPGAFCSFSSSSSAATTVSCTDDGTFTLTLTARDAVNGPASDSATLTLGNVAPGLGPLPVARASTADDPATPPDTPGVHEPRPWQVFRAGTEVTHVAAYTEPGANDTHTCVTDWDDGTSSTYAGDELTCRATHTFTHPGMYTIKTKVTDDDTGSDTADVLIIVYDPDAGFATAGGHLTSPAGALTGDPSATGRGHFQFNPKYHPHDEGPAPRNGKVSYEVKGLPLDLTSSTLEWLVVTPDDKIAVKGVSGDQGFVLYAYDSNPDRFRLVVWPTSAGDYPTTTLTYDNVRGAGYDLDMAQPQTIDHGSIQAHR
ncbi:NucA/NucB deoxyribonuclease domain-containing protein [Nonomuraea sp. CA-218870]|uniref:PKD domain-containing protein n=1 Tax=Nonomuraea sp. CA-218870 TaxID=3239998 RepID=UPI003D947213